MIESLPPLLQGRELILLKQALSGTGRLAQESAVLLLFSWQQRKMEASSFGPDYSQSVLKFGMHKGMKFGKVDPSYLLWLRNELRRNKDPNRADLLEAVENYLNQSDTGLTQPVDPG